LINLSNISKVLGGKNLFSNVSFQINPGEKIGLVGANGTGKTTIFRLIVGDERPDEGQVSFLGQTKIAYFSQEVGEMHGRSALEEVIEGNSAVAQLRHSLSQYEALLCDPTLATQQMNEILEKMGDAQIEFERRGGYTIESEAQEILTGLGITPEDHNKLIENFSGGRKMRIALAKVLIVMPDLILMDEPTNYLDMETILWLEKWCQSFKGAILMTSHDREFLNRIIKKTIEIAAGKITIYSGNYDFYTKERAVRLKQNEAQFNRQQDMLKKEEEFIARFQARASHAAQVQSRVKKLEKIERVELVSEEEEMSILLPEIPRGGNDVAVISNLSKTWYDSQKRANHVFSNLTTTIRRQEKIAVVGVNGAGKSTLMKIIAGQILPTAGSANLGPSIAVGYFGQYTLESLDFEKTIFEEMQAKLSHHTDAFLRNLLAAFLFRGDEIFKKIKHLSGGEKARVVLAYLLTSKFNFLILDEPTNHLDIKSREVLLDSLKRYQGTIMMVSHDRYFLHQLTNKVLEVDKGSVYLYDSSYQEYLDRKQANA